MVNEDFIKEYTPYLSRIYRNKNSSLTEEDIQDLVQDTFEKVTLYRDYFDNNKGTLKNWLSMMTVHVYDRFARGSLQIDEIVKDFTRDDVLLDVSSYFYIANKEEVDRFIDMLPLSQQRVVYLKLVLGYSHEEIASKLYISTAASASNLKRGLDNLKRLISSDNPNNEVLVETKILRPMGDKPHEGDWAWRYGESKEQRNSKWYVYTDNEIEAYKQLENTHYKLKVKKYELKNQ